MALFNYPAKELTLKVVYYGPGLSGKTTNLQYLHSTIPAEKRGKLLMLSTESDRTLFFDFLPVQLGRIKDFSIKFQLYTVPGQSRYNATRKLVLRGADVVIFVADSQKEMRDYNIESFENMRENLRDNGIDPDVIPIVLQYNKRDLENILPVAAMNKDLNSAAHPAFEACATGGMGVEETFREATKLLIKDLANRYKFPIEGQPEAPAPAETPPETLPPPPEPAPGPASAGPEAEAAAEAAVPAPAGPAADGFDELAASISGLERKLDRALSVMASTGGERIKKAAENVRAEKKSAEAVTNLAMEVQRLNDNLARQTRAFEKIGAELNEFMKKISAGQDEITSQLRDLLLKDARRKRRFRLFG